VVVEHQELMLSDQVVWEVVVEHQEDKIMVKMEQPILEVAEVVLLLMVQVALAVQESSS
jgi:hypothetical protein